MMDLGTGLKHKHKPNGPKNQTYIQSSKESDNGCSIRQMCATRYARLIIKAYICEEGRHGQLQLQNGRASATFTNEPQNFLMLSLILLFLRGKKKQWAIDTGRVKLMLIIAICLDLDASIKATVISMRRC